MFQMLTFFAPNNTKIDMKHNENYSSRRLPQYTGNLKIPSAIFDMHSKWLPNKTFFLPHLCGFQNGRFYAKKKNSVGQRAHIELFTKIQTDSMSTVLSVKLFMEICYLLHLW